jgi:N-acyl homoserine lactone hydrolase
MVPMSLEIKRLHLASLRAPGSSGDADATPVHGFVVTHPGGAVLVDTGVGGPPRLVSDWRVVNTTAADALATLDLTPADISLVINTHLHFDHCGQNAVFPHAAFYVQRAERDRSLREERVLFDWFGFMNARFELLDGDTEILPGLNVITTPGHTSGHQSVLVQTGAGAEVLIGDAAYTPWEYADPGDARLPPGQAADVTSWRESLHRIHSAEPSQVHFCHSTDTVSAHR